MSKIPTTEHWAIIQTTQTWVPGDERSRTNPGHGYPEHTVESIDYHSFPSEAEMIDYIDRRGLKVGSFSALHVTPLTVTTNTVVSVSRPLGTRIIEDDLR